MDDRIQSVQIKAATYENVVVECPHCGHEIILNRRSDLGTTQPIDGRTTVCPRQECQKELWIYGDIANPSYEVLLEDCQALLKEKNYMACVRNVAQAYEVFFDLFLRVNLLYKPFWLYQGPESKTTVVNRVSGHLATVTKGCAFDRMRAIFLTYLLDTNPPASFDEAEAFIESLRVPPNAPKKSRIDSLPDASLAKLLEVVRSTKVSTIRNHVSHKRAYRPTEAEARAALEEALGVLPQLGRLLDLEDEINWYGRKPKSGDTS